MRRCCDSFSDTTCSKEGCVFSVVEILSETEFSSKLAFRDAWFRVDLDDSWFMWVVQRQEVFEADVLNLVGKSLWLWFFRQMRRKLPKIVVDESCWHDFLYIFKIFLNCSWIRHQEEREDRKAISYRDVAFLILRCRLIFEIASQFSFVFYLGFIP